VRHAACVADKSRTPRFRTITFRLRAFSHALLLHACILDVIMNISKQCSPGVGRDFSKHTPTTGKMCKKTSYLHANSTHPTSQTPTVADKDRFVRLPGTARPQCQHCLYNKLCPSGVFQRQHLSYAVMPEHNSSILGEARTLLHNAVSRLPQCTL